MKSTSYGVCKKQRRLEKRQERVEDVQEVSVDIGYQFARFGGGIMTRTVAGTSVVATTITAPAMISMPQAKTTNRTPTASTRS